MKTKSFADFMVRAAIELGKTEGLNAAKDYLQHEMSRQGFVLWEQSATVHHFKSLLKGYKLIRRAL